MPLSAGSRVGSYEILAAIGAGGMGEVYRARDSRLDRDVALKILPDAFASDADRLARFEREARTLAALNHPNIAQVYEAGKAGPTAFLAMEFVAGDDLSVRIARAPIPLADAVAIAKQIADALEAAHESGIIHRDLKPANIKVRDDGVVKVLDFGLAKAVASEGSAGIADAMNSPTLTARATQMGVVLGTAAYMSPEQARGRPVDRRADIWAFGVVLYEMLSGRRTFDGEDVSVTLANVIKEHPQWHMLPPDVPASLRRLLRRCLEKDPKRRLSAIADARLELEDEGEDTHLASAIPAGRPATLVSRLWPALAGVAVTALGASALWLTQEPPPPRERLQFTVPTELGRVYQVAPRISPDGRLLAYVAPLSANGKGVIWIRPMDGLEPHALAGTEEAHTLFWSPQSDAIGYSVGDGLYRVGISGGSPQKLCDVPNQAGATWMRSGDILLASNDGSVAKLFRVSAVGGVPAELPQLTGKGAAVSYGWPVMMPDDKHFLYLGWSFNAADRALYAGSLDGGEPVRLVSTDASGSIAPGYLLFLQSRVLYAQAFDANSLELSGNPVRLADNIITDPLGGFSGFSVSATGVLTHRTGETGSAQDEMVWLDRAGKPAGTVGDRKNYAQIRLSPDERRVVFSASEGTGMTFLVSVLDLGNGVSSPLTADKMLAVDPVWARDSQSIAFVGFAKSNQVFIQQVGDAAPKGDLLMPGPLHWLDDWSPDGRFFLLHTDKPSKLYAASPGDAKSARLLLETSEEIDGAHFSPDGKWVTYHQTQSGIPQVWVASFPAFDRRRQVSSQGGGQALWRRDGKELFYLSPAGKLMAVKVHEDPVSGTIDLSPPAELFQSPLSRPNLTVDEYSVTKDGQRFLFIRPQAAASLKASPINVIVNWTTGLGRN